MAAYKKGELFRDIVEYSTYPLQFLYFYDKLIGKTITDNWQYRMIKRCIADGHLYKAELNKGYRRYRIKMQILVGDIVEYELSPYECVARNSDEAKRKTLKSRFSKETLKDNGDGNYCYLDGSGILVLDAEVIERSDKM